ncbi:MAG: head-tail adaptor protein [Rhodobacteraceae bacterium]|nr:head-tail adaptor protein [Paracoccaceae bacterium]
MKGPFSLTRRLVLEEVTRQPDLAGGWVEAWTPLGVVWADIRSGAGRERRDEAVAVSSVAYRVIVRAAPVGSPSRPRAGQRFVEGTRVFAIRAVSEAGSAGLYLECVTVEEVLA